VISVGSFSSSKTFTAETAAPHSIKVRLARPTVKKGVPLVPGAKSASFSAASIAGYDAVVIATDHDAVDYGELVTHARLIVDTRNVCRRAGFDGPHIVAA
jgi:UDP-N-acetyl-D-mannosaminuronate dehydrogenase